MRIFCEAYDYKKGTGKKTKFFPLLFFVGFGSGMKKNLDAG
jgi:hypothetical protein